MGIWGSPFWFGYPQIGSGIHLTRIPILVWGSPFWYGDSGIPVLVWGSPNRFGDPRIGSGILATRIPEPIWGSPNLFRDPQTDMGIPKLKWGIPILILSHSFQRCYLISIITIIILLLMPLIDLFLRRHRLSLPFIVVVVCCRNCLSPLSFNVAK
jgi:hypothetical protein